MESLLKQKPNLVLLGSCPYTGPLIHALNKNFRLQPHLYSKRRFIDLSHFYRYRFERLLYPENKCYLLNSLMSFASHLGENQTSILVPCGGYYERFVRENLEVFETAFIVLPMERLLEICKISGEVRGR